MPKWKLLLQNDVLRYFKSCNDDGDQEIKRVIKKDIKINLK